MTKCLNMCDVLRTVSGIYKHYGIVSYFMTLMENVHGKGLQYMGISRWRHLGESCQLSRGTRDLFSEVPVQAPLVDQYVETEGRQ